jgi:hypothetical protein
MATTTINTSTLTAGQDVTIGTLNKCLDRILNDADRNSNPLATDEYQLLHALRYGTTTGSGSPSGIVITY